MPFRSKLQIFSDFFPPGYKAGGPVKSCQNIAQGLGERTSVVVYTSDTELGEHQPFTGIESDTVLEYTKGVQVCYLSLKNRRFLRMFHRIGAIETSVFYLNSMFSIPFTLAPLVAKRLGFTNSKIVLAPRGMLKPSALQFKSKKKLVFLQSFKLFGFHHLIDFHATSASEAIDIKQVFGNSVKIYLCPQAPDVYLLSKRISKTKNEGQLRLVMVGRMHPIKNILTGIELLKGINGELIQLDIIGPFENVEYLESCRNISATLPGNIQVHFIGEMPPNEITPYIQKADFFYLLTQGENFGHAIFEALALGKPVIISDQTPWLNLAAKKAGWDLPLTDFSNIKSVLQTAVDMDDAMYQEWSDGAFLCAQTYIKESDWEDQYLNMFFGEAADLKK